MISIDLANTIRDQIASDIHVEKVGDQNAVVVHMPFIYDDGDQFSVFATRRDNSRWLLTDDGDVIKRAYSAGTDLTKQGHSERLRTLIGFYGVSENEGALELPADDSTLTNAIFRFTQTCLEATWLSKLPKLAKKSEPQRFAKRIAKAIEKAVPREKIAHNWYDDQIDPERIYLVDYRIEGKDKQLFLFGVSNESAGMRATITCQHFQVKNVPFEAVVVYKSPERIAQRTAKQLNDVAKVQFSGANDKRLIEYLQLKAA